MDIAPRLVTEAEFLSLPETSDRVELVDGEVLVAPSPSFWHQEILRRMAVALSVWAEHTQKPYQIGLAPLDVRFGPSRILQPDLFVLEGVLSPNHHGPVDRVPLVCVEVLSSNRSYDRITKRFIYAQAGVTEYWILSAAGLIERWGGDALETHEEVRERLADTVLPGFELDVGALFHA